MRPAIPSLEAEPVYTPTSDPSPVGPDVLSLQAAGEKQFMVPTGNVTLWVRRASLHTFVIIFISLWYIILCIGLFLWWSQYFSLYSNKNQPLSVKSCRFFCAVWLNLYLSPLGNFLFRYSQNNFSRLLDVLFILRQSFLIMKLYKNIKSGPQTPVFSLYLRYNWNLFCYKDFLFPRGSSVVPTSFGEMPMSLPVGKCHLCVWGMNVYVELLLESWPFSPDLSASHHYWL